MQPSQDPVPEPSTDRLGGEKLDPSVYDAFGKEDRVSSISWYLITSGIVALVLAGICLWMGRTGATAFFSHKDFSLNPVALARYLLLAGLVFYATGRGIAYWRRFKKR